MGATRVTGTAARAPGPALLSLAVAWACACTCVTVRADAPSAPPRASGKLTVRVIDETGAPLAGAEVTGRYQRNPGPVASTCCIEVALGPVTTGPDGVAKLTQPALTFGPLAITARRADWPPQTTNLTALGAAGPVTIALGPARAIAGRLALPDDCPPGFLEAAVASPSIRAPVAPDGRFVLPGMGPGLIEVGVSACGRSVTATVDGRAHREVTLALPPSRKRQQFSADPGGGLSAPPAEYPQVGAAPDRSARPAPCGPRSADLLLPGDFDAVSMDPGCRHLLARERAPLPGGGRSWQLARPSGGPLRLGGVGADPPLVGARIALGEALTDRTAVEAVDLATGGRRVLGHSARFRLGAGDVAVLFGSPPGGAGAQDAGPLELAFADGRRRTLTARAAADWNLLAEGGQLLYRVVPAGIGKAEAHLYDLGAGRDLTIAVGADRAWSFPGASEVVIAAGGRLFAVAIDGSQPQPAAETAASWQVLGPDLFIKEEARGAVTVRTRARNLLIPFAWAEERVHAQVLDPRHLLLGRGGDLVLVPVAAGQARLLAEGVRLSAYVAPPAAGDWVAVEETTGRALLLSLSGRQAPRAVGRGTPRSFSGDGRWLAIQAPPPQARFDLVWVGDGPARSIAVAARAGRWANSEAAIFLHTVGNDGADLAAPLYAVSPDHPVPWQVELRVVSYTPLADGDLLVVVPPGGDRTAGIWRRPLAPDPAHRR